MFFIRKRRRKRASSVTAHYLKHRQEAQQMILSRVSYWNQFYGYAYNRVVIRNQKRCWGSCTSLKNLNFSYKILFLPDNLRDYIIVHELCHLQELNHGKEFWNLVEQCIPAYRESIKHLKNIERNGLSVQKLEYLRKDTAVK